ncbi:o-succinylbenzoate synthase [Halobacillus sp. K22]|uniref:o-succinylbenzoate synthase n=1 Tax=Halobacillus sp. K22 TaxID=3457431 RepID=UPI003FCEC879
MNIEYMGLRLVELPLRSPFRTHQGVIKQRPLIIVEVADRLGIKGYGEVTAFAEPFYTSETIQTAWHIISDCIVPTIDFQEISHPFDFPELLSGIQGHPMAKAGVEGALWDLYGKQTGQSLSGMIGGRKKHVKAGAVISLNDTEAEGVKALEEKGYERYKLKVDKGKELEMIERVKQVSPDLPLMIDANGAYTEKDIEHILALDECGLTMIEQPFQAGDFFLHQQLQNRMKTPVCLDESVMNFHDAMQAIQLGSCQIINVKISRVGGLTAAIKIHDYCAHENVPVWCGGMIESGISKAHNLALASLPNFSIPGDLSGSDRYFEKDLVTPGIRLENGEIEVPSLPGIGIEVDISYLERVTKKAKTFRL